MTGAFALVDVVAAVKPPWLAISRRESAESKLDEIKSATIVKATKLKPPRMLNIIRAAIPAMKLKPPKPGRKEKLDWPRKVTPAQVAAPKKTKKTRASSPASRSRFTQIHEVMRGELGRASICRAR